MRNTVGKEILVSCGKVHYLHAQFKAHTIENCAQFRTPPYNTAVMNII